MDVALDLWGLILDRDMRTREKEKKNREGCFFWLQTEKVVLKNKNRIEREDKSASERIKLK